MSIVTGQISGPLKTKPKLIFTEFQGLTLSSLRLLFEDNNIMIKISVASYELANIV